MDDISLIIVLGLIGFGLVAFLLLFPVYRFLKREEEASKNWTEESLRRKAADPNVAINGDPDRKRAAEGE
jgi:hypothetical protein